MAGMGRAVLAGAPAMLRQRDLKCKHGKTKNKNKQQQQLIDACFGNHMKKIKNKIKAGWGGGGGLLALQGHQTNTTTKI